MYEIQINRLGVYQQNHSSITVYYYYYYYESKDYSDTLH